MHVPDDPDLPRSEISSVSVESLVVGESVGFAVRVRDGHLQVEVDGRQVVEHALRRELTGRWGLGAGAGSAGNWRALRVE